MKLQRVADTTHETQTRYFITVNMKKFFLRLLKNAQMQGPRSPEAQENINRSALGGVRRNKPAPCLTRGRMRETPQMGVFQQPANSLQASPVRSLNSLYLLNRLLDVLILGILDLTHLFSVDHGLTRHFP